MMLEGKSWYVLAGQIPWMAEGNRGVEYGFGIRPDVQPGEIRYRIHGRFAVRSPVRFIRYYEFAPGPQGSHHSALWTGRWISLIGLDVEYGAGWRTRRVLWRAA